MSRFTPLGTTKGLVATTTSQTVALTAVGGSRALQICNAGTGVAFLELGGGTTALAVTGGVSTALATASFPVLAASTVVIEIGPGVTGLAAVLAAGTGQLYFTEGQG